MRSALATRRTLFLAGSGFLVAEGRAGPRGGAPCARARLGAAAGPGRGNGRLETDVLSFKFQETPLLVLHIYI